MNGVALAAQSGDQRTHFHAHFLGLTVEVAYIATLGLGAGRATFSGTGHAGDVIGRGFSEVERRLISSALFLVSASEAVRRAATQTFPNVPNEVVHCGVARAQIARSAIRPPGAVFTVLTVARVVEKKGYDVALDAAAQLVRRSNRFNWLAIGTGPDLARLAQQSAPLESLGVWSWLGSRSHDEVLRRLDEEADVFVLPCIVSSDGNVDGIPVALMEAMARGIPVITSDVGGIGELVIEGETGRLLTPGDRDAVVSALETLGHDQTERRRLGLAGMCHVNEHFSQETEARKLAELFLGLESR
jgi:glycosyltransferase involved in cell wall biosynthesis